LFLVIDILKFGNSEEIDRDIDRKDKMGKSRKRTKEKTKIGIHRIPYSHVYTHTLHARLLSQGVKLDIRTPYLLSDVIEGIKRKKRN